MRISLIKKDKIENFILPSQIHGNYWITDRNKDGKERNFINIIEDTSHWRMISNYEINIYIDNEYYESVILEYNKFYTLKVDKEEDALIYCSEVYENNIVQLMAKTDFDIMIGNKNTCQICYNSQYIAEEQARLIYKNNEWNIINLSVKNPIYINNEAVNSKRLNNGDVVFIMGLKLTIIKNNVIINNTGNIKIDVNLFAEAKFPKQTIKEFADSEEEIPLYKDTDYFFKAPRFKSIMERIPLQIDPAPQKEKEDKTPIIYIIGPMLTMGLTSAVTIFSTINNVVSKGNSLKDALPSLIIAGAMLITLILWPLLTKQYQKKQQKENEQIRRKKYFEYIENKRNFVRNVMKQQTEYLNESYPPLEELKKIIMYRKTNLWEREIEHEDFLRLRIGLGTEPVNMEISYPQEHFSMEEDDLKDILKNLVNDSKDLENVPITVSFADKYVSSIVGETPVIEKITYGLILQLIAYHSYDDLKLVFFTQTEKEDYWYFAKVLPHCWNDDKSLRYFATNIDEMKQISSYLEGVFQSRMYDENNPNSVRNLDYKHHKPYYFIITDNLKDVREIEIIKDVLEQKVNVGFSILILNDKLTNLPNECMDFICIGHNNRSVIFEGALTTNRQKKFTVDVDNNLNLNEFCVKLANIPIDISKSDANFPKVITFLEMYNVGKVEQLNSLNRWEANAPINSLQVPIGVDKQGNLFKLDLHEKFHGPHGLIAGMTGSGKSELIITYILSLAVNYNPDEVSFIVIDYKGGGVAGAFENKETGVKLPHIAGTITNLDTVEMNRSLVSIESELRRRQKAFNKARELSNESTIDIYKYQRLYRNGVVNEPISHLFIICDEFAELKIQQPEFMDQLISTARIGRSLGVHLILATQKPSGVVDDQIWSNSRFRICLKVQEKEDSIDMIKSPDAALLKDVGRFYLQVGYNEFYAQGLSAWCGAQYIPTDKLKKKVDSSIDFIDNIGYVVKSVDQDKKGSNTRNNGEQLSNIVNYLIQESQKANISSRKLWLDRIPDIILVDNLKKKYSYKIEENIINPVIGEYDDPGDQKQGLLTLNLSNDGNAIIYGSSGSGKSVLISSLIYSTIIDHGVDEVNFYILDFGSEVLKIFYKAPQIGDILLINDTEKIGNLFKTLYSIMNERKKLFVNYNGDFNFYNKKSSKKLPLIVVIINNYEAFYEVYDRNEEQLVQLTREGPKYGVVFVITVNGANTIRYKLKQNFKQEFVLQMNDSMDYSLILGNTNKVYPSKAIGRGILRKDKIYEFQTAYPSNPDDMAEYIADVCDKLKNNAYNFASQIAILPEIVTAENINSRLRGLNSIPIGIEKNTLEISEWDFNNNYATIITASEFYNMKYFISPFIGQFGEVPDCTVLVVDSLKEVDALQPKPNTYYYDKEFDNVINSLYTNISKQYDIYTKNNYNNEALSKVKPLICIIVGIESLLLKLSDEVKKTFESLVKMGSSTQTIKFVLIDSVDVFKKIEYDTWYKEVSKNNQGIWLGNGIADQFTIKINKFTRELQEDIDIGFGYVVKRGNPVLTKFLTTEKGYKESEYE